MRVRTTVPATVVGFMVIWKIVPSFSNTAAFRPARPLTASVSESGSKARYSNRAPTGPLGQRRGQDGRDGGPADDMAGLEDQAIFARGGDGFRERAPADG